MSTAGHLACLLVLQNIKFHQKQLTIPPSHFLKLTELNLQLPQIYTHMSKLYRPGRSHLRSSISIHRADARYIEIVFSRPLSVS